MGMMIDQWVMTNPCGRLKTVEHPLNCLLGMEQLPSRNRLVVCNISFSFWYVGNNFIPTDFHLFQRSRLNHQKMWGTRYARGQFLERIGIWSIQDSAGDKAKKRSFIFPIRLGNAAITTWIYMDLGFIWVQSSGLRGSRIIDIIVAYSSTFIQPYMTQDHSLDLRWSNTRKTSEGHDGWSAGDLHGATLCI